VHELKAAAGPLLDDGSISLDAAPRTDMRQLHSIDFHQVLLSTGRHSSEIMQSGWFLRHRLAVNILYAHLARLGITPLQRYLFCHLVSSAVEEEFGISPMEKALEFTRGTGSPPATPADLTCQ
jgi:hypothetical protein